MLSDDSNVSALIARVEQHVAAARADAHALFLDVCRPTQSTSSSSSRDEVNVPSCNKLAEIKLEGYYGNFHLVLAEDIQ